GGGATIISLNVEAGDPRWFAEPRSDETPERSFERRWALTVLETALALVRSDYELKGRGELINHLEPFLTSDPAEHYRQAASGLSMAEAALKQQVSRLRQRFRRRLRELVSETVVSPEELDDELVQIQRALGR